MSALGFYISGLAPTPDRARSLAQSEAPDLVLMDINLQGGRAGHRGRPLDARGVRVRGRIRYRTHRPRHDRADP
ncbi:MAG: hypothetical protein R3D30_14365 [Hyphomicrobiales bacterium]